MVAKDPRNTTRYKDCVRRLRARADVQNCWRCGKELYADLRWPHPLSITLGHYIALEDGGDPYDPSNHGPECRACNMGDGARRTNEKRAGRSGRQSYTNDDW